MRLWFPSMLGTLLLSQAAYAQCASNASSCVSCHEAQALRPVLQSAQAWHRDHAFGDLCSACHAGDPRADTAGRAHVGLRQPLLAEPAPCAGCHAADAPARIARYLAAFEQGAPRRAAAPAGRSSRFVDLVLGGSALALGFPLYLAFRKRREPREPSLRAYAAGAALGCVVAFSELVYARPVAVSGAFDKLAAYLGQRFLPASQFYRHVMAPGITWQFWVVCGIALGSFVASCAAGQVRLRWLPDSQWRERFGRSRWRRMAVAFAGGALVQFGAGIAGGCTSGLAISGGAALAPAAFLFMAGMFAGGIPTAWLWYRGVKD